MSSKETSRDLKSLKPSSNRSNSDLPASLKPPRNQDELYGLDKTLTSNGFSEDKKATTLPKKDVLTSDNNKILIAKEIEIKLPETDDLTYSEVQKKAKLDMAVAKDKLLLSQDNWLMRNGHKFSYIGIFLFTLTLYFRPYELIPGLSGFSSMALYIAIATIVFFIPTQFMTEGNLTARPPEVNYILLLTLVALLTIPIAKSPALSWETFNDTFIRVVLMFIVMVNVIKTETRLRGLMLLSVGIGFYLSVVAINLYQAGEFAVEGYRVSVDLGGMFGNPNELATHFVMFLPVSVALAISSKKFVWKVLYYIASLSMVAGIFVTQSRGAFLGLIICGFIFAWKIGKNQRFKVTVLTAILSAIFLAAAPNNYGLRVLSIVIPGLDLAGSADQRKELLIQSLIVTLRNPWGTGMGGFTIGSVHNLQTHNGFTQVSSELGIIGLVLYLLILISPIRRLGAIERECYASKNFNWIYYLSIGVQVSIIAYMVASFFGSFAYNWFVYFPIAYAIAIRRIYAVEKDKQNKTVLDFHGTKSILVTS